MTASAYIEQLRLCPLRPKGSVPRVSPRRLALIREHGIIEPVWVRPAGEGGFEILANAELWLAAQHLEIERVPIHVLHDLGDAEAADILSASVSGYAVDPIEEAQYFKDQLKPFAALGAYGAVTKLALLSGRKRAYISHALRLLKLPKTIQTLVRDGALSAGHARAMITIIDLRAQAALAKRAISEQLTVRQVESLARAIKRGSKGQGALTTEPTTKGKDPNLRRLEQKMAAILGCGVAIDTDRGQLTVDYYNLDILQGVLSKLGLDEG